MKVAVFGGSFDPPHVAHVLAAHYVLSIGEAEKVLVVPVYRHAFEKELSSFEYRVEMCEAAFEGEAKIVVSRIESTLPPPNYTLNTLKALRAEYPGDAFRLVIGADVLSETIRWHRFEEITRLAPPLVLGRAGVDSRLAPKALLPEVSSSAARTWFEKPVSHEDELKRSLLIPAQVRDLIEKLGLYR